MAKFTKEQAVESITAKFTDKAKGIDLKRTIEEAVSNGMEMIGENSEMELDAFVTLVEKNVSSALGLARHLKTDATTEMQRQLDEMKAKLEGKNTPPTPPKPNEVKSDDPAMQAILDKLAKMEEKMNESDKQKSIADKRSKLVEKMKESIKDEGWINDYLAEIPITEEMDVEAKAKDYVNFYNKTVAGSGKRSVTPKATGTDDDDITKSIKSTVAAAAQIRKNNSIRTGGSPVETTTTN